MRASRPSLVAGTRNLAPQALCGRHLAWVGIRRGLAPGAWAAVALAVSCPVARAAGSAPPALPSATAQVTAILGTATYQVSTNIPLPVRLGTKLPEGSVVRTGPGSALDLSLGQRAGVVRLAENTALTLEQLSRESAGEAGPVQVHLSLQEGTLLGLRNSVSLTDRFEVKTPRGVAAIGANLFRIEARGYVVVLSGKVLFAHAPAGAAPVVHKLEAPPPVYFSPHEGVRPAPAELEREVRRQCLPRLPSAAPAWDEQRRMRLEPPGTPRLGPWPHAHRGPQPPAVGVAWADRAPVANGLPGADLTWQAKGLDWLAAVP